jgi:hypothetical protein
MSCCWLCFLGIGDGEATCFFFLTKKTPTTIAGRVFAAVFRVAGQEQERHAVFQPNYTAVSCHLRRRRHLHILLVRVLWIRFLATWPPP